MALLAKMTFMLVSLVCSCVAADKALHLKSYSEDDVKGCYEHNQTLGVCFDVKKDFMKIQKTTGEVIVLYQELGQDMFLCQILGQAFLGLGPSIFYAPVDVQRNPEVLRDFLEDIKFNNRIEQQESLRNHYQTAMSELHYVPEVQLVERLSASLSHNSTQLRILQPFHALCFNLMKMSDVEIPDELKATPDMDYETADQNDPGACSQPTENNCRGLCGKECWCWSWFCGDCCWHRGCYEHDICCKYGLLTSYCVFPFWYGFTCEKFGGYPACLNSFLGGWWK